MLAAADWIRFGTCLFAFIDKRPQLCAKMGAWLSYHVASTDRYEPSMLCCFFKSLSKNKPEKNTTSTTTLLVSPAAYRVDTELFKLLFTSAYFGRKKTLQSVVDNNESVNFSSVLWSKGLNALHIAAMRGHLGCVKILCCSCKFDIDALDEVGMFFLQKCLLSSHYIVAA